MLLGTFFYTNIPSYLDFYLGEAKEKVFQISYFVFASHSCLTWSQSLKGMKSKQLLTHRNNKCIWQTAAYHSFSFRDMETPESGEEGASCFANLLWCPIETQHPCLDVWMSPGAAENARGKKLVQAMRSRRKRWVLCKQSQKNFGNNCLNHLGKLMECHSYGGFLAEVVFIGWV